MKSQKLNNKTSIKRKDPMNDNSNNNVNSSDQGQGQYAKLLKDYTDTVPSKTLLTADSKPLTLLSSRRDSSRRVDDGEEEKQASSSSPHKDRLNVDFDPFSTESAHRTKRSLSLKWFGSMEPYSLRRGSIGLISAILGTGILALPQGMAEFGWVSGMVMLALSALCHLYSFYLLAYAQALVPKSDSYTEMVDRVIGGVRFIDRLRFKTSPKRIKSSVFWSYWFMILL